MAPNTLGESRRCRDGGKAPRPGRPKNHTAGNICTCAGLNHSLDTPHASARPVRLSVRTPGFQPGKRGSIPLRAASRSRFSGHQLHPNQAHAWPVRLSVRTPGFQPGKRGSIPLRAATASFLRSHTASQTSPPVQPRILTVLPPLTHEISKPPPSFAPLEKNAAGVTAHLLDSLPPKAYIPPEGAQSPSF